MGSEIDLEPALKERLRERALALGISLQETFNRALTLNQLLDLALPTIASNEPVKTSDFDFTCTQIR
jgi:hypothetical protein